MTAIEADAKITLEDESALLSLLLTYTGQGALMEMGRMYFGLWYRFQGADAFLLWYTDEQDGVVVDETGRVLSFSDPETLKRWARLHGWKAATTGMILHDLDAVQQWIEHPSSDTIDCDLALAAWNMFIDVRVSIGQRNALRDDPENDDIYDKLFFGNNLPSMTPPGEHYIPVWSAEEAERLKNILSEGLNLFQERVYIGVR